MKNNLFVFPISTALFVTLKLTSVIDWLVLALGSSTCSN